MKKWIVRFIAMFLFNLIVLVLIGLILGHVDLGTFGLNAIWASVVLTLATLLLKRAIHGLFTGKAEKSAHRRNKVGEWFLQFALVYGVALIIWLLVVALSGVEVDGVFWWWFLPPLILLAGWALYDVLAERVEARGSRIFDKAMGD